MAILFKNIITNDDINYLVSKFESHPHVKLDFQTNNSYVIRQAEFLYPYLDKIKPTLEKKSNLQLKAKYCGIRKYVKGNHLTYHVDNAAEYAISVMLKQSDNLDNPILIHEVAETETYVLNGGDGVFFNGMKVFHQRPPIKSEYLYHLYLGYDTIKTSDISSII